MPRLHARHTAEIRYASAEPAARIEAARDDFGNSVHRLARGEAAPGGPGRAASGGPNAAFHPVNHRGAGDSMTGATAAGMAAGQSAEEILRLAVAAAALNVTRHGLGSGDSEAIERLAARVDVRDWPSRRPSK